MKMINYILFRALLPSEAQIEKDIRLGHLGLGVIIHPSTTIGRGVFIWQGVNIVSDAAQTESDSRVTIGDNVEIGAQTVIINRSPRSIVIGSNSRIGAGALVTRSVPDGSTVVSIPAAPRGRRH